MKKIICQVPEFLARDFKIMCSLFGVSQREVIQKLIASFLDDNLEKVPALKSLMEKFSKKSKDQSNEIATHPSAFYGE